MPPPSHPHLGPPRPPQETVPLLGGPQPSAGPLAGPPSHGTQPRISAVPQPAPNGPPTLAPSSVGRLTVRYPQPGTVLRSKRGDYLVQRVMGAGQFGAVYDCVGPFDQAYAVKVIRPANRPYHEVQAEWAREVQRLFSLRHPNIVYLYDYFEQEHLFYQALERCDHALSEMLGAPMQEGLVLELARQLLAAVQFLHDSDIVHDDLHPGNVLVSHTDRPTLKISDFGISAELRGAPSIRPDVVHHKIMAPEILATGYTSKQSDLYQIGLLLYWMVTGSPAIPQNLPYPELVRFVSEGEPRRRAEAIGTPLGHLIAKMLRRRDTFRYTSAREVWADMRLLPAWQNRQLFPVK
jgi:serine/threonine-protein kinase